MQLALDNDTHDLILKDGGGVERVTDGRYVVQLVKSRLLTGFGEWLLNPSLGWIDLSDYKKNPDLFHIELKARQIILSTPNVNTIDEFTMVLSKRILNISFKATTVFGVIDLTIPWGGTT